MTTQTNEITVWKDDAPVVTVGNVEFSVWNDNAPVVDQDEGNPNQTSNRRRPHIY